MDLGGVVNRHFQQTKNDMYQNSGYCDSRTSKQILNLNIIPSVKTFSVDLFEPLRIDTLSDVYLDNFTTINAVQNTFASKQAFVLSIDQFPIKTNSNNSKLYNKIVIPNEETKEGFRVQSLQVHKARKVNYICSINPQTLTKITGSITDLNGEEGEIHTKFEDFENAVAEVVGGEPYNSGKGLNSDLFLNSSDTFIGAGSGTQICGVYPSGTGTGQLHNTLADLVNTTTTVNDTKKTTGYIAFIGGAQHSIREFKSKAGINDILSKTSEIKIDFLAGNETNGMNSPEATDILTFQLLDSDPSVVLSEHKIWDPAVADPLLWPNGDDFDRITYPNDDISLEDIRAAHAFKIINPNNSSVLYGDCYAIKYIELVPTNPKNFSIGGKAMAELIIIPRN